MNILFLVSSLLLILSFICAQTFHSTLSYESEKLFFTGHMKGLRKTRNMWQQKIYTSATASSRSTQQKAVIKKEKVLKNFSSHRKKRTPSHYSKLNIALLFTEEPHSPLLYETALILLKQLYGKRPFIKRSGIENCEELILAEMLKAGKKNGIPSELQDLSPSNEPLKKIYYRMLKGTGDYDIEKNQGYPPLSDFFSLEEKERKPIYFCFASYPVLSALVGKDLADKIVEKEEEKSKLASARRTLTKQQMQEMLLKTMGPKGHAQAIEELLSFAKREVCLEYLSYKDRLSGVYFTLPLDQAKH